MKKINKRNKFSKRFKRIKKRFYKKSIFSFKKLFLIIIFFILYLYFQLDKVKNYSKILDESKLSKYEHYKILLPKKKRHSFKKINPNDEIKLFKLEDSVDYKRMKEKGNNNYIYHTCLINRAKYENLYLREFVEHYLSIGVEKFYLGDDNPDDVENLSDVLKDYIKKGIVDVEYTFPINITQHQFYEYTFRAVYN